MNFKVKTYNAIAETGISLLKESDFSVSETEDSPDAMILRSYKLTDQDIESSIKAIARAGAGVNNVPVDLCSKNGIVAEFNCKSSNITVINNGLDYEEFAPISNVERNKNRLITTASADVALKGLDFSLKALKLLKKNNPKIHLIIIGAPKKNGHTEKLIKKLNIEDNVFFKKNISKEEIKELYSTSSIA